jgi:2-dehydropantoate 2-reductase
MSSSSQPRILVVGSGALGGLFAARLGRRWPGLHLLDRREDRAAKVQETGLHVTGVSLADWTPGPGRVRSSVKGWALMDMAFFFVKAPAFATALKAASPVLGPKTAVVVFPETVDVSAVKGRVRAVAALTDHRARVEGVGRVFHEAQGDTWLDAGAPGAKEAALILNEALIPAALDKNVRARRWLTLLAQVCVDVPAALTDTPQKSVLAPPLSGLGERLLAECAALAKALKRPVSPAALKERRDALIAKAPEAKSPLGRDLLRGRPTERAALLGPLLAAAGKGGRGAPLLSSMDRLLRRLEKESVVP